MNDRTFLDTNILVYALDSGDLTKQARALGLLNAGLAQDNVVLSAQVLSEFFTVVTKRLPEPLSTKDAREFIELVEILQVVEIDTKLVKRAIETHERYQINYWDGLIIAAAERGRCQSVLSEDLNAGQSYHDIVVENPFADL